MKLDLNALRFAAYSVVGYGSEVQNLPIYSPRWAGNADSGWSFGVTQTDLGQRASDRAALTKAYAGWRAAEAVAGRVWPVVSGTDLATRNNGGLDAAEKVALSQFLATPNGRQIVDGWDATNVAALISNRGGALDVTTHFRSMDAKD